MELHSPSNKNQQLFLSLLLFFLVVATCLIFNNQWFFDGDDFGWVLRGSLIENIKHILYSFYYGSTGTPQHVFTNNMYALTPQGTPYPNETVLTMYYRPLLLIIHALQYKLFGVSAYGHFGMIITVHALNTTMLFNLLNIYLRPTTAFACSLFFAFHPTQYYGLGKIDYQTHQFHLFFALLSIICLVYFIKKRNKLLLIPTSFFFLLAMLCRETYVVFPAVVLLWLVIKRKEYLLSTSSIAYAVGTFVTAIAVCIGMRAMAYPLTFTGGTMLSQSSASSIVMIIKSNVISKFFQLYDHFWLQFFPWNMFLFMKKNGLLELYRLIKLLLLVSLHTLFITNKRKSFVVLALGSFMMLSWPFISTTAGGNYRYYYEALPFLMLSLGLLFRHSTLSMIPRHLLRTGFAALVFFCSFQVIESMKKASDYRKRVDTTYQKFADAMNGRLRKYPLFIINTPPDTFSLGVKQALQLYKVSLTPPIYHFERLTIYPNPNSINDNADFITTQVSCNQIRIATRDRRKLSFRLAPFQESNHRIEHEYLKEIIINDKDGENIYDLALVFKPEGFRENIKTIAWTYSRMTLIE